MRSKKEIQRSIEKRIKEAEVVKLLSDESIVEYYNKKKELSDLYNDKKYLEDIFNNGTIPGIEVLEKLYKYYITKDDETKKAVIKQFKTDYPKSVFNPSKYLSNININYIEKSKIVKDYIDIFDFYQKKYNSKDYSTYQIGFKQNGVEFYLLDSPEEFINIIQNNEILEKKFNPGDDGKKDIDTKIQNVKEWIEDWINKNRDLKKKLDSIEKDYIIGGKKQMTRRYKIKANKRTRKRINITKKRNSRSKTRKNMRKRGGTTIV